MEAINSRKTTGRRTEEGKRYEDTESLVREQKQINYKLLQSCVYYVVI